MSLNPGLSSGDDLSQRVVKNALWLFVGRLGSQGFLLVFSILLARRLGEVGLGQYAFMTSVVYLGNLASTFGTDMLIMREVAAKKDYGIVRTSLILQLAISLLLVLVVFIFAPALPNQMSGMAEALFVYSFSLVPLAFYTVFSATLRAVERMDTFTWLNLVNGILLVTLAVIYIQSSTSILDLAWMLLAAQLVSGAMAALLAFFQVPQLRRDWSPGHASVKNLLRMATPIAVLAILGVVYQRSAIYLLATLQGAATTGLFSASLRLVEAAKLSHFAVLGAMFPAMAQFNVGHDRAGDLIFSKSLMYLLFLSLGIALAFFFFARPIIFWLYGSEFADSVSVLKLLAWLLIPVTLTHYYSLTLLSAKQEWPIMLALIASLVVLLMCIFVGLNRWGLAAVAVGMLVGESVQAAILFVYWTRFKISKDHSQSNAVS